MHIDAYSVYMCLHFVGDRFFRVDPLSSWVCAASGKGLHDTATATAPQSAEAWQVFFSMNRYSMLQRFANCFHFVVNLERSSLLSLSVSNWSGATQCRGSATVRRSQEEWAFLELHHVPQGWDGVWRDSQGWVGDGEWWSRLRYPEFYRLHEEVQKDWLDSRIRRFVFQIL